MTELIITLLDGSTQTVDKDKVKEISQDMGDVNDIYNRCSEHPLFGHSFCSNCKAITEATGTITHCDKWFIEYQVRSDPEPITVELKDGSILQAQDVKPVNWFAE